MGRKSPHDTVIPLCKHHHDEFHRIGKKPWELKYGEQMDHLDRARVILKMSRYERALFG